MHILKKKKKKGVDRAQNMLISNWGIVPAKCVYHSYSRFHHYLQNGIYFSSVKSPVSRKSIEFSFDFKTHYLFFSFLNQSRFLWSLIFLNRTDSKKNSLKCLLSACYKPYHVMVFSYTISICCNFAANQVWVVKSVNLTLYLPYQGCGVQTSQKF